MLIDHAKIYVKAGDGGNGCTSFYRDKTVRKGKANGGYGGDGGDIVFKADRNVQTLRDFQYNRHFKAGRGGHGGSSNKKGKDGNNCHVMVPAGTMIKDAPHGFLLRDLTQAGEEVIVALGGKGGKGNSRKKDATPGEKGESKELALELKLIADVGIIGFPNVGKSTFISRISRARSKIANYPFTTKTPVLGILSTEDSSITFADMPGLIEGAHSGRGLGDEFLRHIERTKVLLHMVDIAEAEKRNAVKDYTAINRELSLYGRHLAEKPQVVACNKMDLPAAKGNLKAFMKEVTAKIFPIAAVTGDGIEELLKEIEKILE